MFGLHFWHYYQLFYTLVSFSFFINKLSFLAITIAVTEFRTKYRRSMEQCDSNARLIAVESLINHETVNTYF